MQSGRSSRAWFPRLHRRRPSELHSVIIANARVHIFESSTQCHLTTTCSKLIHTDILEKEAYVNQKHQQTWWSPVVHFGVHIVVGSLIFVLISLPAFGLGLLVQYLAIHGTAPYVIQVLTLLEYAIVTIDAMAFLAYLVITGINAVREMTE